MRLERALITGFGVLTASLATGPAAAADPTPAPAPGVAQSGVPAFVQEVWDAVLAAAPRSRLDLAVAGNQPPPRLRIIPECDGNPVTACAWSERSSLGRYDRTVGVTPEFLRVAVRGERDVLAFVLGHELAHLLLPHGCDGGPDRARPIAGEIVRIQQCQDDEIEADRHALELVRLAGFSERRAIWGMINMRRALGETPGFLAVAVTHPSWASRAEFLNGVLGDREQAAVWRAIEAFDSGVLFLLVHQYESAVAAFRASTAAFPDVPRVWANLGYSLLMDYLDGLTPEEIRDFGFPLGRLASGGFYPQSTALERPVRTRALQEDLWQQAISALRRAEALPGDLIHVRGLLGVAYLVAPPGDRAPDVARRHLEEAVQIGERLSFFIDADTRAIVQLNAAVAALATGDRAGFLRRLSEAQALAGRSGELAYDMRKALEHNRLLALAGSTDPAERRRAAEGLRRYLRTSSPNTVWWDQAYELYATVEPRPTARPLLRVIARMSSPGTSFITGVTLPDGRRVDLGDRMTDVAERLGSGTRRTLVSGTALTEVDYPNSGIAITPSGQRVAMIRLSGQSAAIAVRDAEGGTAGEIRIGMSLVQLERLLGQSIACRVDASLVRHRCFNGQPVAIDVRDGRVMQILLAPTGPFLRHLYKEDVSA